MIAVNKAAALGEIGGVFFVAVERHATGLEHLELVRGFGEPGLSVEDNARKELMEETGLVADRCRSLGSLWIDTGMTDARVELVIAEVRARPGPSESEPGEAITRVVLLSETELRDLLEKGLFDDAITVAAISLYLARSSKVDSVAVPTAARELHLG